MDILSDFEALLMEYATNGEHERMHLLAGKLSRGYTLATMSLITKVVEQRKQMPYALQTFDEYAYEYLTGVVMVAKLERATLVWYEFGIHLCLGAVPAKYAGARQLTLTQDQAQARAATQRWLCNQQLPCARVDSGRITPLYALEPGTDTCAIAHHPVVRLGVAGIASAIRTVLVEQPFAVAEWISDRVSFRWMTSSSDAEAAAACSNATVAAAIRFPSAVEARIDCYYFGRP